MNAYEMIIDRCEKYIVLATSVEKAMAKAIEKRNKEYPDSAPVVTELSQLRGTVIR